MIVVTFDDGFMVQSYVRETALTWPVLVDRDRELYRAYGMERGRAWDIFGPAALWAYFRLLLTGRRLRAAGEDVRQLGGDVIVDESGVVRLHHVGSGPADRPPVEKLLAVLDR